MTPLALTLLAPERLWLLAVVAGLTGLYVRVQRRRRHPSVRFSNLALLKSVAPARPGWRRHVPAAGVALSMVGLIVGLARPAQSVRVPREAATVMLVMDMSASMQATDVHPSRYEAAISAAKAFVEDLPEPVRVGLISFDRSPRTIAPPTADHAAVLAGLDSLTLGPGTATGDAVYAAIDALTASAEASGAGPSGPAPGESSGAAIVLLSDGVRTVGNPVESAAAAAAARGIPVSTIAFGTPTGAVVVRGELIAVPADPATMERVAELTSGRFFEAASRDELRSVYEDIGTRVGFETVTQENSGPVLAGAALALTAAFGLALAWNGRLV